MKALAANGAHVIGLARTIDDARAACNAAGISSHDRLDLTDCASIDSAGGFDIAASPSLDAIITNSDLADPRSKRGATVLNFRPCQYIGHLRLSIDSAIGFAQLRTDRGLASGDVRMKSRANRTNSAR